MRREHNGRAWAVWHTAFLTAYAPEKPKKFWKLRTLLFGARGEVRQKDWRRDFDAFAAWAKSHKNKD